MSKTRRINRFGEMQIKMGLRWQKPKGSTTDGSKMKRWRGLERDRKRKGEKEDVDKS